MKGYCSIEDIENYNLVTIEEAMENNVEFWIGAMEKHIDAVTGRNFIADATDTERYYDGKGKCHLFIDDCVEISGIEFLDEEGITTKTLEEGTFVEYPYNEKPFRKVMLRSDVFPCGIKNVSVSGKFGYSVAVPEDIRFATVILVSGIVNFSGEAVGEIKSEKIGDYSVTYKDEKSWYDYDKALAILKQYEKIYV